MIIDPEARTEIMVFSELDARPEDNYTPAEPVHACDMRFGISAGGDP